MTVSTDMLLAECRRLTPELLRLVGEETADPGPEQAFHRLKRAKSRLGAAGLGDALGLDHRNELGVFEGVVRDLAQRAGRTAQGDADRRNLQIAILRFLDFCALMARRLGDAALQPAYTPDASEELGRRQLRALELLVRSLVNEAAGDQQTLRRRLEAAYGAERVRTWLTSADPDDLLSGTTFSELVSIFVDRKSFKAHHEPLFEDTAYLRFLRDRRETIRTFLEDVRRLRNAVAHNRRITPLQLALLDLYYDELALPVDEAHRKHRTAVDPGVFLEVGAEQLDAWFDGLREDLGAIREDLGGLVATTRGIDRRTRFIATGVKALLAAAALGALVPPAWEAGRFFVHRWESRVLANRYADVADQIYHGENNPDVALAMLDQAIALDSGNPRFQTARAYMDGMAAVRELLNLDRPLLKAELDRAHRALARADWLARLDAGQAEPHILRGQIYMALGQEQDGAARAAFETAIRLDPTNGFAMMRLAALHHRNNEPDKALALLDRALAVDERDKWAWMWKGVVHAETLGNWDEARRLYARAIAIDPRFDMAHYNIGWTWMNQKSPDHAMARRSFERALLINPDYKEAYYALGYVYGRQDRYEMAKLHLDRALAIDPNYLTAWKWRGIVNDDRGHYEEAIADFNRALTLSPRNPELYVRRARTYVRLHRDNDAMDDLTFASEIRPDHALTWRLMGDILRRAGQQEAAIERYTRAVEADASDELALAGRAEARAATGDPDGAAADFEQALAVTTYKPERILLRRGQHRERSGHPDEALADYRAARLAEPKHFESCKAEADLLVLRRSPQAALVIKECRVLRPEDSVVDELPEQPHPPQDTHQ